MHALYAERSHSTQSSLAREHTLRKPQSTPLYRSRAITQPKLLPSPELCPARRNWCWPADDKSASLTPEMSKASLAVRTSPLPTAKDWFTTRMTGFKRFPFNNFKYCLTLFSKFFSSFPHGTCSLSVSRQYLALDEIYHPFWAAFPNNSTLWKRITYVACSESKTGFSPSMIPYSKGFIPRLPPKTLL